MDPTKTIGVDCLKLENISATNFNVWHHKVILGMQLQKIYYAISEEKPNFEEDSEIGAFGERDYHFCRSYLLNCLADVYFNKPSTKDIWITLEDQYKNEEKISKFHLDFRKARERERESLGKCYLIFWRVSMAFAI